MNKLRSTEKSKIEEITCSQIELIATKLHKSMTIIESATPLLNGLKLDNNWLSLKRIALDIERKPKAYNFQEINNLYNQIKILIDKYLSTQEDPNEQSQKIIRKTLSSNISEFIGIQIIEEEKQQEKKAIEAMTSRIIMGEAGIEDVVTTYSRKIRDEIIDIFYTPIQNLNSRNMRFQIFPPEQDLFEMLSYQNDQLEELQTPYITIKEIILNLRADIEFNDGDSSENEEMEQKNKAAEPKNNIASLVRKGQHNLSPIERLHQDIEEMIIPKPEKGRELREKLSKKVTKKKS